jgi:hypothetical protein
MEKNVLRMTSGCRNFNFSSHTNTTEFLRSVCVCVSEGDGERERERSHLALMKDEIKHSISEVCHMLT